MDVASSSNASDDTFTISIRSIHVKTQSLRVSKHWTVGQLKDKIKEIEQLQHRNVRIIYHGRDMQDGISLADAGIREGSNVHVSVSNQTPKPIRNARLPHYPTGRAASSANDSDSDDDLVGFDRLREMGFSADDVQQIRMQFALNHFRNLPTGQVYPAPQSDEMLQLENNWIDSQFNPNQVNASQQHQELVRPSPGQDLTRGRTLGSGLDLATELVSLGAVDGTGYNLLLGLIIGFLMGLISLVWIGEPSFTRKTRLGMFAGIFANLILGFLASYTTG